MATSYTDQISNLKDTKESIITLKTNIGEKQIPNVMWITGYIDQKITGGDIVLDSYLTKYEAENTYAKKTDIPVIPNMNNYVQKEVTADHKRLWIDQTAEYLSIYAQNEDEVIQSEFSITPNNIFFAWTNGDHTIQNVLTIGEEGLFYNDSSLITTTELVNNYATKTALQTVAEIAQGRTKTYIVESWSAIGLSQLSEGFYTTSFSYINIFNSTTHDFTDTLGIDELKLGDIILVLAKDVPDLYVVGEKNYIAFAELESRTINVENYVTVNTKQNITGLKSFKIRPNIIINEELSSPVATLQDLENKQVELPDNIAIIIDLTEAEFTSAYIQETEEGEE